MNMIAAKAKRTRNCSSFVKELDQYGYPITLTYKNDTEYKSVFGGIATLFFRILVFLYLGFQI